MNENNLTITQKELVKKISEELKNLNNLNFDLDEFNESDSEKSLKQNIDIKLSKQQLSKTIDHTLLKPEAVPYEIEVLCKEAIENDFASVCVNPAYVKVCADLLKNSEIKVCCTIGFPLGASSTKTKKFEVVDAIENGAAEVDMVINVGQLKAKNLNYIYTDIKAVTESAAKHGVLTKVIIETCLLTDEEKITACLIAKAAKADFVKTSTGFNKGGATASDVALMKYTVGTKLKVKASGGVRAYEDAILMIKNGADRIGASAGIKIINGGSSSTNY